MWTFLFVGSFGAVGGAMALGTLTALLRYHWTGAWPGQERGVEVTRGRLVGLWARVIVGAVITVLAVGSLVDAGLL